MQRKNVLYLLTVLVLLASLLPFGAVAQEAPTSAAQESIGNEAPSNTAADAKWVGEPSAFPPSAPVNPAAVLYDNGPLTTHPGGGAGGANASAVQTALGNSTYGFNHSISGGFRIADDFTVPSGGWNISTITFYAYQTGSTTTSTFNNVNLQIWNGVPGAAGSSVVFGDTTTNRLASTGFSSIYRVLDTALTNTDRPIMANVVTVNTILPAGTYWLDWQAGGTLTSGPWAPPVTILGQTAKPGANALQLSSGSWVALIDTGAGAQQDLPFVIEGSTAQGPSISVSKTVGTTSGVCATTSAITVPEGTTVYYCYEVTNTGDETLNLHTLTDNVLGSIFTGLSYALAPGASVNTVQAGLSIPYVANTTTTNTATWTAYNTGGSSVQATDSATVTVIPNRCPAGSTEVTVLTQDFTGSFPPAGWVVANSTTGCVAPGVPDWTNTDPGVRGNLTGGSGAFAIADSDVCGSGSIMNAQMWTPVMDLTGLTNPQVSYQTDYNDLATGGDLAYLDFSVDNGTTWTNLITWDTDHRGPLLVEQAFAAGNQANTRLRWNYVNATYDWWWEVDSVEVTACQPSQEPPNIDVTPAGLNATQAPNTTTQQVLTIANTGEADLTWTIDEEPAGPKTLPAPSGSTAKLRAPEAAQTSAVKAPTADVVQDGSFEAGSPNPFWTEASTNFMTPLCTEAGCGTGGGTSFPLTGSWWAWFGGIAAYEAGSLSQSVTIPAGGPATLTFYVMNGSCSGDASDYLEVNMDGTQLWQTTGAAPECDTLAYRQVTLDVSAYANGAAHTLEFNSEIFGTDVTNFALDDVVLDAQGGGGGQTCDAPSDVPWLGVAPSNGTTAGGASTPVQVTFDSTGLAAGTYNANLCVESNDPDPGPGPNTDLVIVPVQLTVEEQGNPSIVLTKTVGTDSGVCATGDTITVPAGTEVYYCYQVENTGDVALNFHDLVDSELGVLADDLPYVLAPGALSPEVIVPATIDVNTTNVATWTAASNLGGYDIDDTIPYDWQDISGAGMQFYLADDEVSYPLPIGFNFDFFGASYGSIHASSNGFLTVVNDGNSGCCTGMPIPDPFSPNGLIAGWWEDLNPSTGGALYYQTLGAAPNRVFIVQFSAVPHFGGGNEVSMQFKLYEGSDVIEVHYQAAPSDGGQHSAGVENQDGTVGAQYSLGTSGLPPRVAVRYTPAVTFVASASDSATVNVLYPNIFVDPLSLSSTQPMNAVTSQILDVANTGDAPLEWEIDEANQINGMYLPLGRSDVPAGPEINLGSIKIGDSTFSRAGAGTGQVVTPQRPETPDDLVTITHSLSQDIVFGNSVACNAGGLHTDNSYLRMFDLASFGITGDFAITQVEFGVEEALGAMGDQPVTVNLYVLTDPMQPLTFGNLTPIGSASVSVPDQSLSLFTVPVTGAAPAGSVLVVEVFTPEGQTAGNSFFIGSNPYGETSPTYLAAAECGVTEPTTTGAIGFPDMHLVLNVTGDTTVQGCSFPTDVPWLGVNPMAGANAPGTSTPVTVSFDSTGLLPGAYTANLCVRSNDPDPGPGNETELVVVPVELIVEQPTLVCNGEVEGFEDGVPPMGWSVVSSLPNAQQWTTIAGCGELGNYATGNGEAACVSGINYPDGNFDTELRSPMFSLVGFTASDLNFKLNFQSWAGMDRLTVDISTDGGATWDNVRTYSSDQGTLQGLPGVNINLDLSPWAGLSDLMLRWRYYSTAASPAWYAQVDEVRLKCTAPPPTAVTLASLDAAETLPAPVPAGLPMAALPAAAGLALAAAALLRRKR